MLNLNKELAKYKYSLRDEKDRIISFYKTKQEIKKILKKHKFKYHKDNDMYYRIGDLFYNDVRYIVKDSIKFDLENIDNRNRK